MKLYNTLTKKIEDFVPYNKNLVTMYTCGPTVYYYAHIGNLRTYISEDILEKGLRYIGYSVKRCMNITDVGHLTGDGDTGEDKLMTAAKKEHKSVLDIARFYTEAFYKDLDRLNIKRPEIISPATENISFYIKMISKLLDEEFIDTFRYFYPEKENIYSWWSYRLKAREKNAGWRIDYFLTSDSLKDKLRGAQIHTDILGSDHCPVELTIEL